MHHSKVGIINSDQALKQLIAGNKRYVASRQLHPNQSQQRRTELSNDQQPFAVILGCADSRVPPEVIFDCGLGDLFVVRIAGHVMNDFEAIQPALHEAQEQPGDLVNNAARANTKIITEQLKCSKPVLSTLVREGKLKVIPAFYDLDTGVVEILSD
jgi:carbonic anhydrase